jgi:hypothetical protein
MPVFFMIQEFSLAKFRDTSIIIIYIYYTNSTFNLAYYNQISRQETNFQGVGNKILILLITTTTTATTTGDFSSLHGSRSRLS